MVDSGMRTTIAIDEQLIDELMQLEGNVSRSEAIRRAIEEYLQRHRIDKFMELAASGLVDMGWREAESRDLKKVRRKWPKVVECLSIAPSGSTFFGAALPL